MKALSSTNTYGALKALIIDTLLVDPEDVRPGTRLIDDLGADGMEAEDFFAAIEHHWGIEITDEMIARLKTVQKLADFIEETTE